MPKKINMKPTFFYLLLSLSVCFRPTYAADTYKTISYLKTFTTVESIDRAFLSLPKEKINVKVYGFLINTSGKMKGSKLAMDYKKRMEAIHHLMPNINIYNSLLKYLFNDKKIDQIENLLKELKERSIAYSNCTYTILFNGYAKNNNKKKFLFLYDNFIQELNKNKLSPDKQLLSTIISYLGKIQQFEKLNSLWNSNKIQVELDSQLYSILFGAYKNNNDLNKSKLLWTKLTKSGFRPDIKLWVTLFYHAQLFNDILWMEEIWNYSCQQKQQLDLKIYNILIQFYFSHQDHLKTEYFIKKAQIFTPQESHLDLLLEIYLQSCNTQDFIYTLNLFSKYKIHYTNTTYNSLLKFYAQQEDYPQSTNLCRFLLENDQPFLRSTYLLIMQLGPFNYIPMAFEKIVKFHPNSITMKEFGCILDILAKNITENQIPLFEIAWNLLLKSHHEIDKGMESSYLLYLYKKYMFKQKCLKNKTDLLNIITYIDSWKPTSLSTTTLRPNIYDFHGEYLGVAIFETLKIIQEYSNNEEKLKDSILLIYGKGSHLLFSQMTKKFKKEWQFDFIHSTNSAFTIKLQSLL